jgi:ornithine cyclodeaminase
MTLLVLSHNDVTDLLPVTECIPLMRDVLSGLARGRGFQPLRSVVTPPGPGFMVLMPAATPTALGIKLLGIFHGNPALGKDAHQGVVLLLDPATGEPRAVVDASAITAVRTAAVSAVATDVLARPDATCLTVFGTGVQARWHVPAIAAVRRLAEVRVVGRDAARTAVFASALSDHCGLTVRPYTDPRPALAGADIVVTATTATTPVLRYAWLAPGTHVNAVGACAPTARELDTETVARARLVVDRRESALTEAGDLIIARAEVGLGADHIAAELGEVLTGAVPGRRDTTELTVFESLGLAVQDLAAAGYVHERALHAGRGTAARF